MNIKNITFLTGGVLVGFGAAYLYLEDKIGQKYAEMANLNRRAYEKAASMKFVDGVKASEAGDVKIIDVGEAKLHSISFTEEPNVFGESIQITPLTTENAYHKAVQATETTPEMFVSGGVNDYGISYIEEEEYLDEDGRAKFKIDIMMDEHNPIFMMDGFPIEDWDARVGDSILVDMYKLCPPNLPAILYVRNHKTEEDYEVVRVEVT